MSDGKPENPGKHGKWTVAFTLSHKNLKRMEKAMAALGVDHQTFLEYCVMKGIIAAEAEKAMQQHGKSESGRDIQELEALYKLKDPRSEGRGR